MSGTYSQCQIYFYSIGCIIHLGRLSKVFQEIFELVDRYELYGQVAYPKKHKRNQIADIYRWASARNGLFVNPALTEPFGLTLLEAAACGLPMVATNDGGPNEILAKCGNGLLVDVTDLTSLQSALEKAGSNQYLWNSWRENGLDGVINHFSWHAPVAKYLSLMQAHLKIIDILYIWNNTLLFQY